ncbi:MAG: M24 family metallopeptidase [Butyricicoccus sp.]
MIAKIRSAMRELGADAVLLTSELNRRYATGFHSTAGVAYISEKHAVFFTDFRYIEAARAGIQGFDVREPGKGMSYSAVVNRLLADDHVKTIALEDDSLTFAEYTRWQDNLMAKAVPLNGMMNRLRMIKTEAELEHIIAAQRIAERAFLEVLGDIRPGVTEKQIAAKLTYLMLLYGAENMSFDPIVVSGANSSKPHGVPGDKLIAEGDFVTMDFGCIVNGYCSDMTRTVAVGYATDEMAAVYDIVLRAQKAGIAAARPGVTGKAIDQAGRDLIEAAGYGDCFGHGFGHGVGLFIHEEPTASPRWDKPLDDGVVLTAEPGIYLPGKFGVRIEDMLYLTGNSCRNLTEAPKELMIL